MAKIKKPPVIVVLGHVDHGKTSLLDNIRKTHVAEKEVGGITQSIGAWQVKVKDQLITFIDTPGHAAFTGMRSRGTQIADVAILVVAADDSVMPQTKEAIKIIQETKTPFVVAVTKIDLEGANLDKVKADLARENVIVEDYGGQEVMVGVSNKTGKGVDELLEMVLLTYEMNPAMVEVEKKASGFILETWFDKHRGHLVSVIISEGKLQAGDVVDVSGQKAKVRALFDEKGKAIKQALPGQPVMIWGFEQAPVVGEVFRASSDKKIDKKAKKGPPAKLLKELQEDLEQIEQEKVIPIFLKAPTKGALEAIAGSLPPQIKVVYQNVGEVTESEVALAAAFQVEIVTFQLKLRPAIASLAEAEKVKISNFQVIYKLLEEFEQRALKMMDETIDQEILGKAQVLKVFDIGKSKIAGCKVIEGELKLNDDVEIVRKNKIIGKGRLTDLQIKNQKMEKVVAGQECGVRLKPESLDFKEGDMILSYKK
ncbi:MAG: translation initiation factor IF-2 [bacterium]|nr:translation initiation factor IF-2 [bacterium]